MQKIKERWWGTFIFPANLTFKSMNKQANKDGWTRVIVTKIIIVLILVLVYFLLKQWAIHRSCEKSARAEAVLKYHVVEYPDYYERLGLQMNYIDQYYKRCMELN